MVPLCSWRAAVISQGFSASILIVSDNHSIAKLLSDQLTDGDVHVMFVGTGPEALALAARLQPAVVLLAIPAVDRAVLDLAAAFKRAAAGPRIMLIETTNGGGIVHDSPDTSPASPVGEVIAASELPDAVASRVQTAIQQYVQELDRHDRLNELLLLEELGRLHAADAPVDSALAAVSRRLVGLAGVDFAAMRWVGAGQITSEVHVGAEGRDDTAAGDGSAADAHAMLSAMDPHDPADVINVDAPELPAEARESARRLGLKILMRLPLTINARPGGMLVVGRRDAASYTQRQAARLQHVARLVAAMIERTTLLDDGRRQAERLKRLQEIIRDVTTATSMDEMLRLAAAGAAALLATDTVHVWLAERPGDARTVRATTVGPSQKTLDTLAGRVFKSGTAESATRRRSGGVVHTQRAIPLKSGSRIWGVIALSTRQQGGLGDDAERIVTILADNLVVALDHAHAIDPAHPPRHGSVAQAAATPATPTPMHMHTDSIVHDMVQPITAALAMLEMLVADEALSPTGHMLADRMHRALSRVGQTTSLQQQGTADTPAPSLGSDLQRVIHGAMELVEHEFTGRGITLVYACPTDPPPVAGDANALERVFVNVLVNARDAMEGRTGNVIVSVELSPGGRGDVVVVRVRDEGRGIAESVRSRLFEPNVTTKTPQAGRGLGLSICREIVERLGGTIDIEAVEGQGTCFRVTLPALQLPRSLSPS